MTAGERDAQGNITSKIDYRVLQPALVTDPNGNRSAVTFDALGMVVGTAVMGKTGENLGDLLDGLRSRPAIEADPARPPPGSARRPAGQSWEQRPRGSSTTCSPISGRQHDPSPSQRSSTRWPARPTSATCGPASRPRSSISFTYSDGFGREIQKKIQAEPGPARPG